MGDDLLAFAIRKVIASNTQAGNFVSELIESEIPHVSVLLEKAKSCVSESVAPRCVVYKDLNPTLTTHNIYTRRQSLN